MFSNTVVAQGSDSSNLRKEVIAVGVGEVKISPTVANLTIGVQHTSQKAKDALQEVSSRMNAIISDLKSKGLKSEKLQTANISLNKQYDYSGTQRMDKGFIAQQSLVVSDDIKNIGQLIDAVVGLGANEINSIQFSANDAELLSAKEESIKQAVLAAKKQAETSLSALGLSAKDILKITILDSQNAMPVYRTQAAVAESFSPQTTVEGGSLSVTSRVELQVGF